MTRSVQQEENQLQIAIVVAVANNGVIGSNNQLPWHLPDDMKHFKQTTSGHPVVMGRKTYESIGKPLPDRQNIVITTNKLFSAPGCEVAHSLEQAIELAKLSKSQKICIIGGGVLFQQALPITNVIHLTKVNASPIGDITFNFDPTDWQEISSQYHPADERHAYDFEIVELRRRNE